MFYATITTIAEPTTCVRALAKRLEDDGGRLVVAGDRKGPAGFAVGNADFLSIDAQLASPYRLAGVLPEGHYVRKNLAYLHAFAHGATCIYETDDDNGPLDSWRRRSLSMRARVVNRRGWVNVYRLFTDDFVWPRGLPLDEVRGDGGLAETDEDLVEVTAPIQQGLADNSPDVDAVWRLLHDKPLTFDRASSVYLEPGAWCPFNSQSTWWWPQVFPLMYLPSHCSFRMTDIWRGFVAQRCLWEMGHGIVFHAAEVRQDRNEHDLMEDFEAEIPGYRGNQAIMCVLSELSLTSGQGNCLANVIKCYEALVQSRIFPRDELKLIRAWAHDVESVMQP